MTLAACLTLAATATQPATPTSPFNGAWLMDVDTSYDGSEPAVIFLRQGLFTRGDPSSSVKVKADGRFHRLSDGNYVDEIAIAVVDQYHVNEIDRYKGRIVYTVNYVASADGNTMFSKTTDHSKPNHKPVITRVTHKRIDTHRPGESLVSGQWRIIAVKTTRAHRTSTFKVTTSRFSTFEVGGSGFDATIGGPPVPIRGDAETGRVAITMPDDRTIIKHLSISGAPTATVTMVLLPGDRTIKATIRRTGAKSDFSWILHKQD
jgi:hypothetical protein